MRAKVRQLLGDTIAVTIGLLAGCLLVVGAGWLVLLWVGSLMGPSWDGDVHFVVESLPRHETYDGAGHLEPTSYTIQSVEEETPRMALDGASSGRIEDLLPTSAIPGLRVGDRVVCTMHVDESSWGQGTGHPVYDITNCRR